MEKQLLMIILFMFGLLLILDHMAGNKNYIKRFVATLTKGGG